MLKFIVIRPELGEKDVKIHVHHVKHKTDYSLYTDEEWEQFLDRTNVHVSRLIEGEEMFESILPMLKKLKHPSLLIRGQYDTVTCKEQIAKFKEDVEVTNVITISKSGNYSYLYVPY